MWNIIWYFITSLTSLLTITFDSFFVRNGKRAVCNLADETYYKPCSSLDRFSSRWTPSPRDSLISNFFAKAKVSRCSEGLKFTVERTGSSKECSLFFLWTKESFAVRNCPSKNSTLFSSRRGWLVLKCNNRAAKFLKPIFRYISYFVVVKITF